MDALLGDNLEQRLKPDAPKVKKEQRRENWVNKLPKMTISNDKLARKQRQFIDPTMGKKPVRIDAKTVIYVPENMSEKDIQHKVWEMQNRLSRKK